MADNDQNEDLKARMREALERKQQGAEGNVTGSGHHRDKGPAERDRQGGASLFRRKSGAS